MKVLVRFQPNNINNDNFEGARLRKTIKSALELSKIPYTDALMDDFDIAHFMYVEDESVVSELIERNIPIVVSALYCEDDPSADFIEFKNKDGYKKYVIKKQAVKFLDKADLVLVPSLSAKQVLIDAGVSSRIEICPPGVNFTRFDFSRDDEKDIFYRYFNCEQDKKIAVAIGDCTDEIDGLNVVLSAAKICEDVNFYYFAKSEHGIRLSRKIKRIIKKFPSNVTFSNIIPDDVYRSALLNADMYFHPGYKPAGCISVFEAMSAKCQLVMRKQDINSEYIIDQQTAYVASYSETLAGIIKDYFESRLKPTIDKAYKLVSNYDLKYFADELTKYYRELLDK